MSSLHFVFVLHWPLSDLAASISAHLQSVPLLGRAAFQIVPPSDRAAFRWYRLQICKHPKRATSRLCRPPDCPVLLRSRPPIVRHLDRAAFRSCRLQIVPPSDCTASKSARFRILPLLMLLPPDHATSKSCPFSDCSACASRSARFQIVPPQIVLPPDCATSRFCHLQIVSPPDCRLCRLPEGIASKPTRFQCLPLLNAAASGSYPTGPHHPPHIMSGV